MAEPTTVSRPFGKTDAKRAATMFGLLVIVCVVFWFVLPPVQALALPQVPGGTAGPWIVRPIVAMRYGAMAVLGVTTVTIGLRPLQKVWQAEDARLGTHFGKSMTSRVGLGLLGVQVAVYALIFVGAFAFYLRSWTAIGPGGIDNRLPWTVQSHTFSDIVSLECIPPGHRSDSIKQDGPWYKIEVKRGRSIMLSLDNEGLSAAELQAIAHYIRDQSGMEWTERHDVRLPFR